MHRYHNNHKAIPLALVTLLAVCALTVITVWNDENESVELEAYSVHGVVRSGIPGNDFKLQGKLTVVQPQQQQPVITIPLQAPCPNCEITPMNDRDPDYVIDERLKRAQRIDRRVATIEKSSMKTLRGVQRTGKNGDEDIRREVRAMLRRVNRQLNFKLDDTQSTLNAQFNQAKKFDKKKPGPPGPRGMRGPPGDRGARGVPGLMGLPGRQGKAGSNGADGQRGPQGAQGLRGFRGKRGLEGISGRRGTPGLSSKPPQQ